MTRSLGWFALLALVAVATAAPPAAGDHCDTKINVYGRAALTPLSPPPYLSLTQGVCLRVLGDHGIEEHKLPPNTEQVMVRVHGDFGASITQVQVSLNGLGFVDSLHTLYRTDNVGGRVTYNLPEWLSVPAGPSDGELKVTAMYPGGARSVTYSTTATIVPPTVPSPPTV